MAKQIRLNLVQSSLETVVEFNFDSLGQHFTILEVYPKLEIVEFETIFVVKSV
jgi:hypothetical protein